MSGLSDTLVYTRRNLSHIRQVPEKLLDVTLQPIMFVLLFAFVFGGVIAIPGGSYREYLLPGIIVQQVGFGIMGSATSLCTDLGEGVVDRFRTLPSRLWTYLAGHLVAETLGSLVGLTIISITGLAVGWRVHSVGDGIAGFALLVLFAVTMQVVGTFLGSLVRSPDAAQGVVFMSVFPLTFCSNAFVPVDGLPVVLKQVAEWNPFSALTAAARHLFGNPSAPLADPPWPLAHPVLASVAWCAVIMAVFAPLAVARFRARTSD